MTDAQTTDETTRLRDAIAAFIRRLEGRRDMYTGNAMRHLTDYNSHIYKTAAIRVDTANVILNDAAELRGLIGDIPKP